MKILAIETSCDETSAAVVENGTKILSNIVTSSLPLHAKTGGIIPEVAARQQIKYIIPVVEKALVEAFGVRKSHISRQVRISHFSPPTSKIDAIAVTVGPGLIGSLLVGVETAKTLAYAWNKPIIPVNHLIGHIYANWLPHTDIDFPALVLIVSGGHTDLLLMKNHGKLKWLGGTRDDAAGEAFDKIARLLGLPYPGGPAIEKAATKGNPKAFNFPRPMLNDFSSKGRPGSAWDFSFSGLKTAVLREVQRIKHLNNETIADISASVQEAIIDVLVKKTLKAAQKYKVKSILLSGGVAANDKLRNELKLSTTRNLPHAKLFFPEKKFCTDNAAMIASAAYFNYKPVHWNKITANPELYFDNIMGGTRQ